MTDNWLLSYYIKQQFNCGIWFLNLFAWIEVYQDSSKTVWITLQRIFIIVFNLRKLMQLWRLPVGWKKIITLNSPFPLSQCHTSMMPFKCSLIPSLDEWAILTLIELNGVSFIHIKEVLSEVIDILDYWLLRLLFL